MPTPRRSDTRDIAKGAAVNFMGVLARSSNILFLVVLGRLYGVEITGLYLLTRATVDVLSKLGILGLDRGLLTLAARYHAEGKDEDVYRVIGQALFIGAIASTVVFVLLQVFAGTLAQRFFNNPDLALPLRIAGVAVFLWFTSAILLFATRALRIMHYEVMTKSLVEPLSLLALSVVFYFLGWGIVGLCVALLIALTLGVLAAAHLFSRVYSLRRLAHHVFDAHNRGAVFAFSAPIGLYDLLNLLLQRLDLFLVGRFLPAATAGIYGVAQEVASPLKAPRQAFDPIFIPVVSAAHQLGSQDRMRAQYQNVTRWILVINAGLLGFMVLASEPVMHLFGKTFTAGATVTYLLAGAIVINGVAGVSELFILIDRPLINLANTLGTLLVSAGLNLYLIPRYGIEGAAAAMVISFFLMNTARVVEVKLLYGLQPFTRYHLKALVAGAAALALMWLVRDALPAHPGWKLAAGLAYLPLYGALLWTLGPADEERRALHRIRDKLRGRPTDP